MRGSVTNSTPADCHAFIGGVEVIDAEEQADAAGELVADGDRLMFTVGSGEQDAGGGAGRADGDPSLRSSVVRDRRGVFDEVEAQRVDEEPDRRVVIVDDDGHEFDVHRRSV